MQNCIAGSLPASTVADNVPPVDLHLPIGPSFSSSFLGLPYRILNINHKKELLASSEVHILNPPKRIYRGLNT